MATKKTANSSTRPPIVAVLGHVDHGKTSLLDAIRSTNVQAGETGGITQHIGAYQVSFKNKSITFIDTPGHAAFTAMRARGGQTADLAILVVAADDGVMPQTKESISHIKSAGIPFIVALNKIDLPGVQTDRIKSQLAESEVLVEGFGGNVPIVEISATKKTNLDTLLDTLLLLAELQELKANPEGTLEAVVIESNLDKNQGPFATVIVKEGTLKTNQSITTVPTSQKDQPVTGKTRALKDWQGSSITTASPATPCQIIGLAKVPPVGSLLTHQETLSLVQSKLTTTDSQITNTGPSESSQNIILKTDVVGTLEAINSNLPKQIHITHAGTGDISESDVLLADTSNARIYGFRVKPSPSAKKLGVIEKVSIQTFDTIYDLLDSLKALSKKTREDQQQEIINGEAKILKIFNFPDLRVLGCVVISGTIKVGDKIHLQRADGTTKNATTNSLKIGTKDVKKVAEGQEFGIILAPDLDAKPSDTVVSYIDPEPIE